MKPTESVPAAVRPRPERVKESCAPWEARRPAVSVYGIVERLSPETVRLMAGMLALVHPRHFETLVMRDGAQS